jgi:hypothetical protein
MTTMTHDGYVARIELDEEASLFHGAVINTRDVLTFQGRTLDELKAAFADTIDDYTNGVGKEGSSQNGLTRETSRSGSPPSSTGASPQPLRARVRASTHLLQRRWNVWRESTGQYDFGRPSTRSAMCDRINWGLTGAMRAIWISRK